MGSETSPSRNNITSDTDLSARSIAWIADWAKKLGWVAEANGKPNKTKVHRILTRFATEKLAESKRGSWTLTAAGRKEAEKCL